MATKADFGLGDTGFITGVGGPFDRDRAGKMLRTCLNETASDSGESDSTMGVVWRDVFGGLGDCDIDRLLEPEEKTEGSTGLSCDRVAFGLIDLSSIM